MSQRVKRSASKTIGEPLDQYRYVVQGTFMVSVSAETVENIEYFVRGLSMYDLTLVQWGDAVIQQAYENSKGEITYGPIAEQRQPALWGEEE